MRPPCTVAGCDRRNNARGLCRTHYARWQVHGDPLADRPVRQIGEGWVTAEGYRMVKQDGRYRCEHRIVMEALLDRPLRDDENVHHINGVRDDNRPQNLELWVTHQPTGQRVEDLVAWAHEILGRYT